MSYIKTYLSKACLTKDNIQIMILLVVVFMGIGYRTVVAAGDKNILNYKQISTVEYSGNGQFRNQVDINYVVETKSLPDNKVRYVIFPDSSKTESGQAPVFSPISFVVDKNNKNITADGEDLAFLTKVHNQTVKSLNEVTKNNIGITWRQSVNLSSLGGDLPDEMKFTLTAIQLKTDSLGDMIAVRALSEPFVVKISNGFIRAKINAVYLFDSNIDNVYLSVSVFEASTSANKINETFRHEVATFGMDAEGNPLSLNDIGRDFERFIAKVGLKQTSLAVSEKAPLPQWVQSVGIRTAQIASICSAAVCEGALNPVALISMPTAGILEIQRGNAAAGAPILQRLINGFGWNWETAAVIGAGVGIGVAINEANDDGSHYASPH